MNSTTNAKPFVQTWSLIGRMQAGWYAHGNGQYSERYDTTSSGGTAEGYATQAVDGTLVYDASECSFNDCANVSIKGPIVNVSLAPFEVSNLFEAVKECPVPQAAICLETLAQHEIRSLSNIGVGIYEAVLRRNLPGARFGTVKDGAIVWE